MSGGVRYMVISWTISSQLTSNSWFHSFYFIVPPQIWFQFTTGTSSNLKWRLYHKGLAKDRINDLLKNNVFIYVKINISFFPFILWSHCLQVPSCTIDKHIDPPPPPHPLGQAPESEKPTWNTNNSNMLDYFMKWSSRADTSTILCRGSILQLSIQFQILHAFIFLVNIQNLNLTPNPSMSADVLWWADPRT